MSCRALVEGNAGAASFANARALRGLKTMMLVSLLTYLCAQLLSVLKHSKLANSRPKVLITHMFLPSKRRGGDLFDRSYAIGMAQIGWDVT